MAVPMRALGNVTRCTVMEVLLGLTEENILVNIKKTRKKGMESSFGQMAEHTVASGLMVSSTEEGPMSPQTEKKNSVNGEMANESDGSQGSYILNR